MIQLKQFFPELNKLHQKYGDPDFSPIYGAGQTKNAKIFLLLMNPTAKNISALPSWNGIRAPWIGTKNIWKLLHATKLLSNKFFIKTQTIKLSDWTPSFVKNLYLDIAEHGAYLTNLAKCTQIDARPLKDSIFKDYLPQTFKEILAVKPKALIPFGNQVSSLILKRPVKVSGYTETAHEVLKINDQNFNIYPTFYPVGQGMRNMGKAINRISKILDEIKTTSVGDRGPFWPE